MNLARLQDTKSIHRKHLHFYILTEKTEREIKESIPFTIAMKRIKTLFADDMIIYIENPKDTTRKL